MEKYGGIAVYFVSEAGPINPDTIEVRVWRAGEPVPKAAAELDVLGDRLVAHTTTGEPGLYWVSVHRERQGRNMVFALTVLDHCAATIVLQLTKGIRIFQYQPTITGGPATTPNKLRHVEYLERLLLSGRLDGARELAVELAKEDDPFVNCLAGYVLLRLGLVDDLGRVAEKVVTAAPQLSDGYVLLGEHAAATNGTTTKQAFNEAVAAGIPMFAEGLTRLLEGLRTNDVDHPRKAIVRYVFQNHMRGCMWSVFTPERFKPGTLVVTAADTGLEACALVRGGGRQRAHGR